jgi:hypothetical protein
VLNPRRLEGRRPEVYHLSVEQLAPLVFLQSFPGHAANDIAFLSKALLPGLFVGY